MKRLTPNMDSSLNQLKRSIRALRGEALMACPHCTQDMEPRRTDAELHVDPTGYGVYVCHNQACHYQPRYRRADIDQGEQLRDAQRDEIREQQLAQYYRLVEEQEQVTSWLREHPTMAQFNADLPWSTQIIRLLKELEQRRIFAARALAGRDKTE